ncbi:MAG TPA: hypothetical protein VK176_10420 [Phycisphaerales bacterium]|nr:hypothetical protein [Phycisphaerales bacterium]
MSWRILAPTANASPRVEWAVFEGMSVFSEAARGVIGSATEGSAVVLSSRPEWEPENDGAQILPTWMGAAARLRPELPSLLESLAAVGRSRGVEVLLLPELGGVISDVPSILSLGRELAGKSAGLIVEPAALLTPSMVERVHEHLTRLYSVSTYLASVRAIVCSDVVRTGEEATMPVAAGAGAAGPLLRELVENARGGHAGEGGGGWQGRWVLDGAWPW